MMSIHIILSVLCIQESWAHEEMDIKYFSLPNYTLINANRRLSLHGGLIIYIHDDFAYTEISVHQSQRHRHCLKVYLLKFGKKQCHQKYVIGNIYRLA